MSSLFFYFVFYYFVFFLRKKSSRFADPPSGMEKKTLMVYFPSPVVFSVPDSHICILFSEIEELNGSGRPAALFVGGCFCLVQNKRSSFGRSLEITAKPCTAPPTSLCMCPTKTGQQGS